MLLRMNECQFNMNPFDLQVNGFGGVDFNRDGLTAEEMRAACEKLRAAGGGQFLATIITADLDAMCRRLAALVRCRQSDPLVAAMMVGIHLEGPFINESHGYVGAHPVAAVIPGEIGAMQRLLEAAEGLVKLVTLAPERDPGFAVTRMLAAGGICVSAGHCDPTLSQLRGAIDHGLKMFTHLGNGCPTWLHRHDNIIQRVLSVSDELWVCFIADGVHVPFPILNSFLRLVGIDRSIVVTDAISAAGLGPGDYSLGERKIAIGEDGVAWSADGSHFVGSTVTMRQTRENLQVQLGLGENATVALLDLNPRRALGVR
jgi:N-acetylglucosamine-6-phosphate deacetylase